MYYNIRQEVEGELEHEDLFITYKVTWLWEYIKDEMYIESIDEVVIYKDDEEIEDYFDKYPEQVDKILCLIRENAEEPDEWEEPDSYDLREAYYEQENFS